MKKKFYILCILLFAHAITAQKWQKCNAFQGVSGAYSTALCVHQGKLFQANHLGLRVSSDLGVTWKEVNNTCNNVFQLLSTGNRLYMIRSDFGCSDIQYSMDGGQTFIEEETGLAACSVVPSRVPNAYGIAWKSNVVLSLSGADSEWSKNDAQTTWNDITYFDPNDPADFFIKNDTCWATTNGTTSNGIAWSIDGLNWTSPPCTGIPGFYAPNQMAWVKGRVLMTGADTGAGAAGIDTILKYSDDYGNTFQEINIKKYLGPSVFFSPSGKQQTNNMFSGYGKLYLALSSQEIDSAPDLLVSNDLGNSFQRDTAGFPLKGASTLPVVNEMAFLNGWAFAQLNNGDVYRKLVGQTSVISPESGVSLAIFPNPVDNQLNWYSYESEKPHKYIIYNMHGQLIQQAALEGEEAVSVDHLNSGCYQILFFYDKLNYRISFMKK